jgi:hypothetical protein
MKSRRVGGAELIYQKVTSAVPNANAHSMVITIDFAQD